MNLRGISFYLGIFCFPISFLSFLSMLYSSYFDYLLNFESYIATLVISLGLGLFFYFLGKNRNKKIDFHEQILLVFITYFILSLLISIPYYLSGYQISFIDSLFESYSGITGTGFTIFNDIKYLDPTLILWRSSSQWIGGLLFLIFLCLFFSNSQFNYKLTNIIHNDNKSLNPDNNFKDTAFEIFFIYLILSLIIFIMFSLSGIRLFSGLNLSMTLISAGGFLPSNNLELIIKNNLQQIALIFSFLISIFNVFLILNLLSKYKKDMTHFEDIGLLMLIIFSLLIFTIYAGKTELLVNLIHILSSIGTSGISFDFSSSNFSLFFLFLTIVGGSIFSNTSGVKYLRIYVLLKAASIEMLRIVKPNNIFNKNILFSKTKIENDHIKLSFLVFISFFISLFVLSTLLLFDSIDFENSLKLSILTLTNTTNSNLFGLNEIKFFNLLTSSKIAIIIFMTIGKIELISFFLIVKKLFFKN